MKAWASRSAAARGRSRGGLGPKVAGAAALLLALAAPAFAGAVTVPPHSTRGVAWAAGEVRQVLPDGVRVDCTLHPAGSIPSQGYGLRGAQGTVTITASDAPGLIYGLLELRDRIAGGLDPSSAFRFQDAPRMPWRALSWDFHMYLGIPLYNDQWRGYEPNDHSPTSWFHDREMWRRELRRLASDRLNAILFVHPHPFPAFLDYSARYPEAAWLTPDELAAKRDALRWLIAEAREYGVTIHFLTWNIWLPRGFAQHHGIAQYGVDSPLTRQFTRWSVAEMYRTYPGLGGLVTQAAEQPPGCTDFVRDAIVGGLRQITPRPTFFFWSWCSYPEQARSVVDAYDGPSYVMNYLQYEQFFADRADPRIGLFSRDLGGRPMVALGGPKGAHNYLFWGDPETARNVLHDLYANNNGRGIALECVAQDDRSLARATLARYAWDPTDSYDETEWLRYLADRYGYHHAVAAAPLLAAMKAASRVIPRQMHLTHSQTGAFMPQLGPPLVQMLEMPSISTYVFENVQTVGPDGYLTPNMGLSRPNPDWGERVVPVRQFAIGLLPAGPRRASLMKQWMAHRAESGYSPKPLRPGDTTPLAIADDLDRLAATVEDSLPHVVPARRHAAELARILDFLRIQAALARHFAAKDRAALAWERYRLEGGGEQRRAIERGLAASVAAWDRLAPIADRLHPAGAWYTQSAVNYPPPWSQMDLWNGYISGRTTFAERGRMWRRERELIRLQLASAPHDRVALPLYDDLRVPQPGGRPIARFDFEAPDDRIRILSGDGLEAALTDDPDFVLQGRCSLLADSRASDREWNTFFETLPDRLPLDANAEVQVIVRYRVIAAGDYRAPFGMALRTDRGGVPNDVGDVRMWSGPENAPRERVLFARLRDLPDYHLFFCIRGRAAIVLDDIRLERLP